MQLVPCCESLECRKDGYDFHRCFTGINSQALQEYFPQELIDHILGVEHSGVSLSYLDQIIVDFMNHKEREYDVQKIISLLMKDDRVAFYYTPIIIYILKNRYDKYFKQNNEL